MKKLKGTVSHREWVVEDLRADPKLVRAYLLVAMEDEDPRVFLTALRNVAEARGMPGYRRTSRKPSIARSLPRAVLKAAGLRLSLQTQKYMRDRAA